MNPMKLIILDRDGTINEDRDDFVKSPDEWVPIPGALEAAACGDGDRAAVLRSVSPLGVITQRERASLPAEARQQ